MKLLLKLILSMVFIISTIYASEDVPTQEEVAKLYVATFNRAPDSAGLLWWTNSSNLKLSEIAQSFFDQPETQTLYPVAIANRDFINSVYQNLFNRAPDTAGWDYWENELNSGAFSKNRFIEAVINGAQNTATSDDATILNNKNSVGIYFAQAGLDDTTEARDIMNGVTAEATTVNTAFTSITNNINNTMNNLSLETCSEDYQTIINGKCVLKTCETDAYGCPVCESGTELKYFNNGFGYCADADVVIEETSLPSGDYGDNISASTTISTSTTALGSIGIAEDSDYFKIIIPSSGTLTIETTGSTDTYGYLYDSSGAVLSTDDDSGASFNFQIIKTLTAGTYYINVKGVYATTTGSYSLVSSFESSSGPNTGSPDLSAFINGLDVSILDSSGNTLASQTLALAGTPNVRSIAPSTSSSREYYVKVRASDPSAIGKYSINISGHESSSFTIVSAPVYSAPNIQSASFDSSSNTTCTEEYLGSSTSSTSTTSSKLLDIQSLNLNCSDVSSYTNMQSYDDSYYFCANACTSAQFDQVDAWQSSCSVFESYKRFNDPGFTSYCTACDGNVVSGSSNSSEDAIDISVDPGDCISNAESIPLNFWSSSTYRERNNINSTIDRPGDEDFYKISVGSAVDSIYVEVNEDDSVTLEDHGNNLSEATLIGINSVTPGYINSVNDVDYFKVVVERAGELTLSTTGNIDFRGYVSATETKEDYLGNNQQLFGYGSSVRDEININLVTKLAPGTYYFTLLTDYSPSYAELTSNQPVNQRTTNQASGNYTLTSSFREIADDHGDTPANATLIGLNATSAGTIDTTEDIDYFKIVLENRGELALTLNRTSTDTPQLKIYLYDKDGYLLEQFERFDNSNIYDIALRKTPYEKGEYYIKVDSYGQAGGTYELLPEFAPNNQDYNRVIPLNYTVSASIVNGDGRDDDYYVFIIPVPGTLTIKGIGTLKVKTRYAFLNTSLANYLEHNLLSVTNNYSGTQGENTVEMNNVEITTHTNGALFMLNIFGDSVNDIGDYSFESSFIPD